MKLSDLKAGDKFRTCEDDTVCEFCECRTRLDGATDFVTWDAEDGFDIWYVDKEVILIREPQYKPYSDLRLLVGKAIRWKDGGEVRLVIQARVDSCVTVDDDGDTSNYDRDQMLEDTTHLDGTPCGELME